MLLPLCSSLYQGPVLAKMEGENMLKALVALREMIRGLSYSKRWESADAFRLCSHMRLWCRRTLLVTIIMLAPPPLGLPS
jgi:hypothetical protein